MKVSKSRLLSLTIVAGVYMGFPGGTTHAESLAKLLPKLLQDHERVMAAALELGVAKDRTRVAEGDYLPSLDFTGNYGYEHQNKAPGSDTTSTAFNEASFSASQLLWDFGKTLGQIDRSKLAEQQAELRLAGTRQALLREAAAAYLNLLRVNDTLGFARQSEDNIRNQTKLEDALVQRRSGLATDVLQAKATLAGAQATRVRAEGALSNARSRFKSVFREDAGDLASLERPKLPLDRLPASLDEAIKVALDNNIDLKIARLNHDIAKKTIDVDRANLVAPEITLNGELNYEHNVAGTLDTKIEKLVKVEATYNFFSGFKDVATYKGSIKAASAAVHRERELRRAIEERVRSAWQNLQTQRANAQFLRNQSNISGEFLEKARRERQLGNRSLVDILAQETVFINSVSAALSAETDTALAFYNVLFAMGVLKLDVITEASN